MDQRPEPVSSIPKKKGDNRPLPSKMDHFSLVLPIEGDQGSSSRNESGPEMTGNVWVKGVPVLPLFRDSGSGGRVNSITESNQ